MTDEHAGPIAHEGDAWGQALLDQLEGRDVPQLFLEVDTGEVGPAMQPEWFFRPFEAWDWWERELFELVTHGPVLDLGCGAGRAGLHLQALGYAVRAIDAAAGAVEVTRRRGAVDAVLGDLNSPPTDQQWGTVLLLCGNLGLGGSWDGNRRLLARLSDICAPEALLIGDSVNYSGVAEIGLRIRYRDVVTPWWRQCNVAAAEVDALVEGTGWSVEKRIIDGADHAVALRNAT